MKSSFSFTLALPLVVMVLASGCSNEASQKSSSPLEAQVDSLMQPFLDSGKLAGATVAVFKGSEKMLLKGYGFADLEFDVKMPVDASFQIGSVTKQFTAAAVMLLAEEGKLNLDDDITKYIKFNTGGRKITIRHLLSHTSGIKGYTELPSFGDLSVKKMKRDTLLRIVEKEAFDFEPGEALIYNNTAFFMAGLIIEKVSGVSYEEYVKKNLFDKAGMTNSYYTHEVQVVKNRAHGYNLGEKGLEMAMYLDHTWPFSAGSLSASAGDLVKWNQALHHGKILSEQSYREFLTPVSLNDGTVTRYAKGITVTEANGRKVIEHGGGINGFLSENVYYPAEDVSIVVLVNTTGPAGPGEIADKLAAKMWGALKPSRAQFAGDRAQFAGTFSGRGRGVDLTAKIEAGDSAISFSMNGGKARKLTYKEGYTWTDGPAIFTFIAHGAGLEELRIDQVYGYLILKKAKGK